MDNAIIDKFNELKEDNEYTSRFMDEPPIEEGIINYNEIIVKPVEVISNEKLNTELKIEKEFDALTDVINININNDDYIDYVLSFNNGNLVLESKVDCSKKGSNYFFKINNDGNRVTELYRRVIDNHRNASDRDSVLNVVNNYELKKLIDDNIFTVSKDSIPENERYELLLSYNMNDDNTVKDISVNSLYLQSSKNNVVKILKPEHIIDETKPLYDNFNLIWYAFRVDVDYNPVAHYWMFGSKLSQVEQVLNSMITDGLFYEDNVNLVLKFISDNKLNKSDFIFRLRYDVSTRKIDRIYIQNYDS